MGVNLLALFTKVCCFIILYIILFSSVNYTCTLQKGLVNLLKDVFNRSAPGTVFTTLYLLYPNNGLNKLVCYFMQA
jgi:hypothetical protein